MVREEILRAVAEPKARDLRSEFLGVPEDLGPEDLRVVFQRGGPSRQLSDLSLRRAEDMKARVDGPRGDIAGRR